MQEIKRLHFVSHGDDRGKLIALESLSEQVPFDIKRIYYIFDTTPGTIRGKHAHVKLKQVLICVSGYCVIRCDLGNGKAIDYLLNRPDQGLLLEGLVWHDMLQFSKDAVLLVLASDHYDESDYIRDYDTFLKEVARGK
ncbi:MAG: FdtA/QdtA family cupin domain-containing protein [Kiritimatiellae bacterium]|nr:FdtA/QdtA family cupin domain-containing protein [Kiritimatiellia bacterium]